MDKINLVHEDDDERTLESFCYPHCIAAGARQGFYPTAEDQEIVDRVAEQLAAEPSPSAESDVSDPELDPELEAMTVPELVEHADELDIDLAGASTKAEKILRIMAAGQSDQ